MSGRGRGKSRGGRGNGRFGNRRNKSTQGKLTDKKKKTLSDHNYYLGSSKQASDFETTTEFIINHIKKTYTDGKDIAKALYNLEPIDTNTWKPSLQVSVITGDDEESNEQRDKENREYEMFFKQESQYSSRVTQYEDNLIKLYALLWERCSVAMKNKISNRQDFKNSIYDNPINLLKAIKEHALNYQEYKYSMSIVSDSLRNLLHTKQKENENLQEYAKRFRTAEEIFQSHLGGPMIIPKIVGEHPNFLTATDETEKEEVLDIVYQQFLAFIFMEQADQSKYGSLL